MSELREALAKLEHEQWMHWMKYFFKQCSGDVSEYPKNIGLFIKTELIDKWIKQTNTPYSELTEKEKDSDRKWADRVLKIIKEHEFLEGFHEFNFQKILDDDKEWEEFEKFED